MTGEYARRFVADHAPVADCEEFGTPPEMIDGETFDHSLDMPGVARVLDVEEDCVPGRRPAPFRRRRWDARGERGLRCGDRHRELGLGRGRRGQLGEGPGDLGDGTRLLGAAAAVATGGRSFHVRIIRDTPPTGQGTEETPPARGPMALTTLGPADSALRRRTRGDASG